MVIYTNDRRLAMNIKDIPAADVTGWCVIPDVTAMRPRLQNEKGQRRGNVAADSIQIDSKWRVVFDLRLDGLTDGFVCERPKADGSVASVCWNAEDIRGFYKPRS